jgi:translation initiation factor 3 subunit D
VTDQILSYILASPKSVYPWDLVLTNKDGKIFIDKREESGIDDLEFNCDETAKEQPVLDNESIDSMQNLSIESKKVNESVNEQVVLENTYDFGEKHPLESEMSSSVNTVFRYRKFKLGESLTIIVRTEINSVSLKTDGELENTYSIRTLTEYEPKQGDDNWTTNLDKSKGKIFTNEIKNNSFKICRWSTQALLAGTDYLKVGFAIRKNPKSNKKHVLAGFIGYTPSKLSDQLNMGLDSIWPILKNITEVVFNQGDGKYHLVKEPNENKLKLLKEIIAE